MESLNKAFISIETTGLNPSNDNIIEIAILNEVLELPKILDMLRLKN